MANKTRCPFYNHFCWILEILDNVIRQNKEIKGIKIKEEEIKMSLFTDVMITYVNTQKSTIY